MNSRPAKPTPLVKKDNFPIFKNNPGLVYLDNAATEHLHKKTIKAISDYYRQSNANPYRGLYDLSLNTTGLVEEVRNEVRDLFDLDYDDDVVFTRNATEALNLIALSVTHALSSDDEIIIFTSEHHSNLLPWMELARRTGAHPIVLNCDFRDPSDYELFSTSLTPNVRLVAISGMSNVTGFQPNLPEISRILRSSVASSAILVIDAAQLAAHNPYALTDVDYDAVAFSGHKLGAPTGIGALCLRAGMIAHLTPVYVGGETVDFVHMDIYDGDRVRTDVRYRSSAARLEAGTQNIGGIIGLGAALNSYIYGIKYSCEYRQDYLVSLSDYLLSKLKDVPYLRLHFADNGIFTFNLDGVHAHDVAQLLANDQICVRAGHHCAQPYHETLGLKSTVRASLAWYNDADDIDRFISSLATVRRRMGLSN